MTVRTPRQVIDQALKENQFGERLLYSMACTFIVVGLFVLVWAAVHGERLVAVLGAISSALFWPAMNSARQTRKESVAIRLLEAPLSRADTAIEAANMLQLFFADTMRQQQTESQPQEKPLGVPASG